MTTALQPSPSVSKQEDNKKQSPAFDFLTSLGSPVRPDSFDEISLLSITTQSAVIMSPVCNVRKVTKQIRKAS